MAKTPAISIIVPVYKVEVYIKQCIDSILRQTFQDFEVILVDDATPDNSFALCQKLYGGNDKFKFVRHEKNLGLGEARNTGIKHAVGKYIYFLDSDDFILPKTLERFYTTAEKTNAQVIHAAGWYELWQDEAEPILKKNLKLRWNRYNQEGFLTGNVIQRLENHWKNYITWSMAWLSFCRRDFLEQHKIEFLPILSEDETFNFALFTFADKYYIIRDALYVYRRRTGSIMTSTDLDKFSKAIRSIVIGATYVQSLLEQTPKFKGCELWREGIMNAFFHRFFMTHTAAYYLDLRPDPAKNAVVEKTLSDFFAENAPFAKFFFNGFHFYRRRAELLAQGRNQMMTLFNRIEISERKIVFVNFMGKGYGCNPKYIAAEIIRQNLPFELVWLVRDLNEPMPAKIRKVAYGSVDSIYELATAKIIISNTKNLLPFPAKKPGQYFIMTWHGATGFKFIEKDAEAKLSPAYVRESKKVSEMTDLMMVESQEQFDEFRRVAWYDGEILKCGLPRDDIFFNHTPEFVADIRKRLNVPPDNKIIMYAPTFRDNPNTWSDVYKFDVQNLLKAVKKKFGGKWTLFMRLHPNIAATPFAKNYFTNAENVINVTNYPDMQELIVVSDMAISDYSSVVYDFTICNKPVFIFAKDFDSYTKERGFKQLFFDLPYKINRTEDELFTCIKNYNEKKLAPARKKFLDSVTPFDKGHAAEEVVKRIQAVIGNQSPIVDNASVPQVLTGAIDNWKVFTYVREKYSAFMNELPTYKSEGDTPKIFWWCWLQGAENAPPLCKVCLKSLFRNYPDYRINIVTEKNISNFVSFPEHIIKKFKEGKITRTHFSDLLRLELLINHGGIWIDSTVLCTGREKDYLREPLFIFQGTWRNEPAHLGSSCFIVSCKGNPILRTARNLIYKYWQDHDELGTGGFYFLFHCMLKLAAEKYPQEWARMPVFSNVPVHLLQFEFFKKYNPDRFEQIKNMSHFHKLTWKYPPALLASEKVAGTNYDYVMKFLS